MNILFVAPRFHTNQSELVSYLVYRKHHITFHTSIIEKTENHSSIIPLRLPASRLSTFISGIFPSTKNNFWYFPKVSLLKYIFLIIKSQDLLIIRAPNRPHSFIFLSISILLRKKVLIYTQGELSSLQQKETRLVNTLLRIVNIYWFTPVDTSLGGLRKPTSRIFFAPFVCEQKKNQTVQFDGKILSILVVGKYEERKNISQTICQIKNFAINHPTTQIYLTVAGQIFDASGSQYLEKLQEIKKSISLANLDIHFLVNVSHVNMSYIYQNNQIFILPSSREPAAFSILEAISYGLIVLYNHENGTASYANAYINAFQINSVKSISNILTQILNDISIVDSKPFNIITNSRDWQRFIASKTNIFL